MSFLSRYLAVRLALTIVIIEFVVMVIGGFVYFGRFSNQIDRRLYDKMLTAGKLFSNSQLNLASIVNAEQMTILIGEEIVDSMILSLDGTIRFSLNPQYRGKTIDSVNGIDRSWLSEGAPSHIEITRHDERSLLTGIFPLESNPSLFILFRSDVTQADIERQNLLGLLFAGSLLTVVVTSLAIFWILNRSALSRIQTLVEVVRQVETSNDLSIRVPKATGQDELGILQRGINAMIGRLEGVFTTLEERISSRTRDLEIAANVSRDITTLLDEDQLLNRVVERTADSFNLSNVMVFLYEEETKRLLFHTGSGSTNLSMQEQSTSFSLEDDGIVPAVAREHKTIIISDTTASPPYRLPPETRSELAIPMVVGHVLIGVLDLQAREKNRFNDDDIRVMSSLASQIAIAIRNASLFAQAKEARERAEKSDHVKSAFLANMSHELRTPLNAIINFSKFLKRGVAGPVNQEQESLLKDIADSGQHLLNLINDVLDMSKIESNSLKLFVEPELDFTEIVGTALDYTRPLLADKPVKIQQDIERDLPLISGDRRRLLQVMLNLLSNACKFTEQGYIGVKVFSENNCLHISVTDTGPGIAPEDYEDVFKAFKQTESGLRQGGGTGLGLPICRSLTEAHKGKLWFESQVGKGTTFFIDLPVAGLT
jgi:signal transduction histidine kinase/HAMP domain-containing protein